jgi:hypothetical protein
MGNIHKVKFHVFEHHCWVHETTEYLPGQQGSKCQLDGCEHVTATPLYAEDKTEDSDLGITAKAVKELRDVTGYGVIECKKALRICNGDFKESLAYLRAGAVGRRFTGVLVTKARPQPERSLPPWFEVEKAVDCKSELDTVFVRFDNSDSANLFRAGISVSIKESRKKEEES